MPRRLTRRPLRGNRHPRRRPRMEDAELVKRIKDVAYLEGDFVLRSGRRSTYYLDK